MMNMDYHWLQEKRAKMGGTMYNIHISKKIRGSAAKRNNFQSQP